MDLNKINVELPEISAKAYAKLNNLELSHINAQCRAGILPARKMTRSHVCINSSDKGFWHINLIKLREQMEANDYLLNYK